MVGLLSVSFCVVTFSCVGWDVCTREVVGGRKWSNLTDGNVGVAFNASLSPGFGVLREG